MKVYGERSYSKVYEAMTGKIWDNKKPKMPWNLMYDILFERASVIEHYDFNSEHTPCYAKIIVVPSPYPNEVDIFIDLNSEKIYDCCEGENNKIIEEMSSIKTKVVEAIEDLKRDNPEIIIHRIHLIDQAYDNSYVDNATKMFSSITTTHHGEENQLIRILYMHCRSVGYFGVYNLTIEYNSVTTKKLIAEANKNANRDADDIYGIVCVTMNIIASYISHINNVSFVDATLNENNIVQ